MISNYLKERKISFIREKSFENLRKSRNNELFFFDFYLPNKKIIIEFHGIQHFDSKCFGNGDIIFNEIKLDDIDREKQCLKNGFKYFSITYKELDNITNILKTILNEN